MEDHTNVEKLTNEDRRDFLTTLLAIDKGTLILKITIEPLDKETFGGTGDVAVTGQVAINPPRPKNASAFRLTGVDGRMDPLNPNQPITG